MTPDNSAEKRLIQTFKFLKELNELRNPVRRDLLGLEVLRLDTWPVHPFVQVRRGEREEDDVNVVAEGEMEPLIRIRRAQLTPCPKSPDELDGWLKPGWQSADADVQMLDSRNFQDEKQQTITIAFTDSEERVMALTAWTAARTKWAIAERPALAARALFDRIHALWTRMQREGDRMELMLADGMLNMTQHDLRHPVLMQRVNLEFDPSVPEFRFNTGTERVELYRALLRLVPGIEGRMIAHFDKELEQQSIEPLSNISTDNFFRRLVQSLFNDGEFFEKKPSSIAADRPCIWREPVIVLRPRTAGLSTTLDYIVADLEKENTRAPEGLARIVGVESSSIALCTPTVPECDIPFYTPQHQSFEQMPRTPTGPEPDILFSKPANAEQYEIAARLTRYKAVLVQGPPGTGKTHTIANLLGYLLAQGKTALVTAHTTKALRVLRRQIDEALQPLCLSVLEGDANSQAQLSQAAQDIAKRLSHSDVGSLRREAGLLRDKRRELLDVAAALRRELRDARFSEIEEIVIGGEGLSPIEVAKRVKEKADRDGWIPGPLQGVVVCPLTEIEVRQLYASQAALTPSDEMQLAVSQPMFTDLVTSTDFRLLATQQADAHTRARTHRPELWENDAVTKYTAAQLHELHQRVQQSATMLAEEQPWLREILFAGWIGGDLKQAWCDLLKIIDVLVSEASEAYRLIMTHGPKLPQGDSDAEVVVILNEIVTFLEAGGSLGFKTKVTRRAWHQLIETCRAEGRVPSTIDEFRALRAMAQREEVRERFALRWRRAVENLGGPTAESLGSSPERTVPGFAAAIRTRLEWRMTVWEPLIEELCTAGFRWGAWLAAHPLVSDDHGELTRVQCASRGLPSIVEAQAALLKQTELSAALQTQRTYLIGFPESHAASVLLQAEDAWDVETYQEAYRELARLAGIHEVYKNRLALLARLEITAPMWMCAIIQRHKPHDLAEPPGDAEPAWRWRQWLQELERRAAVSMTTLQERLDRTEDDLRQLAAQIIEQETWAAQRERTGLQAQQALMGFVQTMRKVGKGTGKRVPELLRQARHLLASARHAVPVWIMPLSRVFESFDPREKKFDVVIIDEASQSDVTALAALYLGRELVVVGDKEQVTPDAVGQRLEEVERLIATDLQGIPNSHLYDGQTSIYDLAEVFRFVTLCYRLSPGDRRSPLLVEERF